MVSWATVFWESNLDCETLRNLDVSDDMSACCVTVHGFQSSKMTVDWN